MNKWKTLLASSGFADTASCTHRASGARRKMNS